MGAASVAYLGGERPPPRGLATTTSATFLPQLLRRLGKIVSDPCSGDPRPEGNCDAKLA
jgi:hypothetical protein